MFNSSAGGYVQSANLSQRRVITETLNGSWPICAIRAPIYHGATWNGRWAIHKSNTPRTLSSLSRDNSKNSGNIYSQKGGESSTFCMHNLTTSAKNTESNSKTEILLLIHTWAFKRKILSIYAGFIASNCVCGFIAFCKWVRAWLCCI